jgi:hypothetical protein
MIMDILRKSTKDDTTYLSKPIAEMTPIERLKYSQHLFRKKWKANGGGGVSCEHSGRPGTSTLCNKKREFEKSEKQINEEMRSKIIQKVLAIVNSIE